jgi:hypothetical protein
MVWGETPPCRKLNVRDHANGDNITPSAKEDGEAAGEEAKEEVTHAPSRLVDSHGRRHRSETVWAGLLM